MIDSSNRDRVCKGEFASLIAEQMEYVLRKYNVDATNDTVAAVIKITGAFVTNFDLLSPTHQQFIFAAQDDHLARFASEFVRVLATEAMRRSEEGTDGEGDASLAASAMGAPESGFRSTPGLAATLDSMRIEDWAGEVAGQTYLEKNLCIPRSTLHLWKRRDEIVALRKGRRKHVFPLAQFVDGRPAPGIRDVLSFISNTRLAWFWLNRPSPELGGRVPIDLLRQDLTAEVISAARKFSSA